MIVALVTCGLRGALTARSTGRPLTVNDTSSVPVVREQPTDQFKVIDLNPEDPRWPNFRGGQPDVLLPLVEKKSPLKVERPTIGERQ
jgi:hypothetical protein